MTIRLRSGDYITTTPIPEGVEIVAATLPAGWHAVLTADEALGLAAALVQAVADRIIEESAPRVREWPLALVRKER